ncbi:nitroreductase family deazaflavin-dependent oxidoreductase [Streptomonospora sediminis]
MSFDTPEGTRGAQPPTADQMRATNERIMADLRAGGSGTDTINALVLITIGRKSGRERQSPVAYFRLQDGSYAIAASAYGVAKHPLWYYNLADAPDRVRVEVAGEEFAVTAQELTGAERDRVWAQITAEAPEFTAYEKATDRTIPVIRLSPTKDPVG